MPRPAPARPPKISIHLPVRSAPPRLVCQTLDALALLDYPDFEVLVVDNNTSDPALWEPVAERCARLGPRFRFFHLGPWPGFRAGALNFALEETAPEAEIVAVLDSGELVSPDWLRRMVPAFADPSVGFAQSAQDCRDDEGSLFKRLIFAEYSRSLRPSAMTLVRVAALRAGNWAAWSMTEEVALELRLMRQGWGSVHAPESFGKGLMPDDFSAARRQSFRRACGAMRILRGDGRALLSPFAHELSFARRRHFLAIWLPWLGDGIGLVLLLAGLAWSVGLILAPMRTAFPVLLLMLPSLGLLAFKLAGILLWRRRVPRGLPRGLPGRVGGAIAGLALSPTIGKAVLWGLLTRRMPLPRGPNLRQAPAPVRGIAAAREECCLLILAWAAMIGVGAVHGLASWEAGLWCLILLAQSLPCLAAVSVSILAAGPSLERGERRAAPVRNRRWHRNRAAGRRAPAAQ